MSAPDDLSLPILGCVDRDHLAEWFRMARPGQKNFYAQGCGLPPGHPTQQLVADWIARGLVVTWQERLGPGLFLYRLKKCAPGAPSKPDVPPDIAARREAKAAALAGTPAGELLDYVRGLIDDGLPLPTYAAIAAELGQDNPFWRHRKGGAPDLERVRYQLKKLQICGLIRIDMGQAEERIVTCMVSGGRTAAADDSDRGPAALRSATGRVWA